MAFKDSSPNSLTLIQSLQYNNYTDNYFALCDKIKGLSSCEVELTEIIEKYAAVMSDHAVISDKCWRLGHYL